MISAVPFKLNVVPLQPKCGHIVPVLMVRHIHIIYNIKQNNNAYNSTIGKKR